MRPIVKWLPGATDAIVCVVPVRRENLGGKNARDALTEDGELTRGPVVVLGAEIAGSACVAPDKAGADRCGAFVNPRDMPAPPRPN